MKTKPLYKLNVPRVTIMEWTLNLVTITPLINPIIKPTKALIRSDNQRDNPGNCINNKPITIAEKAKIPFFYSENINDKSEVEIIKSLKPDYIFCFGWSKILQEKILSIPSQGTIGFHPTKLPQNRGNHPIIWTIILGLRESATTFFYINEKIEQTILTFSRLII